MQLVVAICLSCSTFAETLYIILHGIRILQTLGVIYTMQVAIYYMVYKYITWLQYTVVSLHFTGSPNCPTVLTTVNTASLTVSIQKSQMMWLPEWYCVKAIFDRESIASIVGNSTLKGSTSFEVTPIQPDTVYNITVIPCNMAGCNESCDVHSVQTEREGEMREFLHSCTYIPVLLIRS